MRLSTTSPSPFPPTRAAPRPPRPPLMPLTAPTHPPVVTIANSAPLETNPGRVVKHTTGVYRPVLRIAVAQ